MFIKIKDTDIYYEKYICENSENTASTSNQTLVFLHGWGSNLRVFDAIISVLKSSYNIYSIDLCGFGNSQEPNQDWSIYEYADMVNEFIIKQNIQNPTILGHSFGGRIGIILSSKDAINAYNKNNPHNYIPTKFDNISNNRNNFTIQKLVLINSAGIIPKRSLSYKYKVGKYKLIKKIKDLKIVDFAFGDLISAYMSQAGSSDYRNASQRMKNILKKAVNEDLSPLMPHIPIPSLLIWGDKDTATPLSDGKKMASLIPNSKLVVFENATHYSFLDKPKEFETALIDFLKEAQ